MKSTPSAGADEAQFRAIAVLSQQVRVDVLNADGLARRTGACRPQLATTVCRRTGSWVPGGSGRGGSKESIGRGHFMWSASLGPFRC